MAISKHDWYMLNRERVLAQAKEYRNAHREQYRTYWKSYFQTNKAILREKHKLYVQKNRDKINEKYRTKYYKNYQSKKKAIAQTSVSPPSPTVEVPAFTMVVSRGDHLVSFD